MKLNNTHSNDYGVKRQCSRIAETPIVLDHERIACAHENANLPQAERQAPLQGCTAPYYA